MTGWRRLSQQAGENGWPTPLPEELKDDLKSTVADLGQHQLLPLRGNAGGRHLPTRVRGPTACSGRTSTSRRPAYNTSGPWGYTPKGGTGVPTRTMFAVLEDIVANG